MQPHAEHATHPGHDPAGGHAGHGGHAAHGDHAARLRERFWWSLALTVPVVAYSEMPQEWLGFAPPGFPGSGWVAPVLGTAVVLYGGQPFLAGGLEEARARRPGMMLLISLALVVGFGASAASALGLLELEFWWELALLTVVMLLGHWLEMRALGQASGALDALAALPPDEAELVTPSRTRTVPAGGLAVGDLELVRPGGRVPADGLVTEGAAELDEQAQASGSRAQALADRAAGLLFWFALGAGLLTVAVWLAVGEPGQAVERTVTVLVIACPHALGLAIPLVIAIATALAARHGILVTDRLALERMRVVDAVLFDKTGTLTRGEPQVTGVAAVDGDEAGLLSLARADAGIAIGAGTDVAVEPAGAVLMSASTIVVALNAQLLRGLDLRVDRTGERRAPP